MRLYIILPVISILTLACEPISQTSEAANASSLINQTKYQFQQPLALRENLLAERGFEQLDSMQWGQLDLRKEVNFDQNSSYFILGKLQPVNELFSTLILLEDHPNFSRSWMLTYNTLGQKIDQLLVYYQRQPTLIRTYGYLKDNQIELTLEGSLKKRYQLSEAGTFYLLENN